MKSSRILVASFVFSMSAAAVAYPDLSGKFFCAADANNPAIYTTVTQAQANGVWSYTVVTSDTTGANPTTEVAIADGVTREVKNPGGNPPTSLQTYTCEGDASVRMNLSLTDANAGKVDAVMRFSIDAQRNMLEAASVTTEKFGSFQSARTCIRQ